MRRKTARTRNPAARSKVHQLWTKNNDRGMVHNGEKQGSVREYSGRRALKCYSFNREGVYSSYQHMETSEVNTKSFCHKNFHRQRRYIRGRQKSRKRQERRSFHIEVSECAAPTKRAIEHKHQPVDRHEDFDFGGSRIDTVPTFLPSFSSPMQDTALAVAKSPIHLIIPLLHALAVDEAIKGRNYDCSNSEHRGSSALWPIEAVLEDVAGPHAPNEHGQRTQNIAVGRASGARCRTFVARTTHTGERQVRVIVDASRGNCRNIRITIQLSLRE